MAITEAEILSRVMMTVGLLTCIGWAFLGVSTNVSRASVLQFCAANLILVVADVLPMFRGPGIAYADFYQSFNYSHLLFLLGTMLFRSGMRELHGLSRTSPLELCLVGFGMGIALVMSRSFGWHNVAIAGVYLACAWYALKGFLECNAALAPKLRLTHRWLFLWPVLMAGVLYFLRVLDDGIALVSDNMGQTAVYQFLAPYHWAHFLVRLLVNASLIGQTLMLIFQKINALAERLQNILDTAPVGVAVSSQGVIRFANPKLTDLIDMKVGDSASKALVLPDDRERIGDLMKVGGAVSNMELQMYSPSHTVRDLLVTYMPIDYEGTPGVLEWVIDMTEQKRIERAILQANNEQAAIFESATLGMAFIKEWKILRANHRLDDLFGWSRGTLVGQSPRVWYAPEMALTMGPYEDILRGEIHYSTQEMCRKDGSRFWCRINGSAIDANDLSLGTVWMFDDVTEERKAAELTRLAKELAEEATQMKSNFLANMSHEIRTPMNAIIGMSQLALKTDLSAKQRNYIEKVDSAARNLLGIINDILDFSKIEAGKMQFEFADFHLEDVLENLADLTVIKAQEKGLELLFDVGADVPTALVGDSLRLGQVLLNLVGNAIKFTDHGEVTVGIHTIDCDPDARPGKLHLRFDIADTGAGLTREQCDKLFSAFSQADVSTARRHGGTGLGLTISKRLVELMEGQISVDSQPGVGSTFTFTAQFGLQTRQQVRPALAQEFPELRILVVDDNARARHIMLSILASQKFAATAVENGQQALDALKEAQGAGVPYGLVLMDWMMHGLDGLETIRRMRAEPSLDETPAFVMVTAHSRDELLEQSEGTRLDGLLLKPVGPSALLDSILGVFGKNVASSRRKHQRREATQEAVQSVCGAYLLLVEDNLVNQELALEILQEAGIRVDIANNGVEAVDQVERADYDGILMDCQMPVMDGFEATRVIRAQQRFADLPILAMTANAMRGDRELCLAAGMNDHIGKPIDVNQLFECLARWIKPKNAQGTALPPTPVGASTARSSHPLPVIASLDMNLAMRRMGGNAHLLQKLIGRFAQTQTDAMARIHHAIQSADLNTATREVHTIKGLAGNIGATRLQACAGTAEAALQHGRKEELPQALEALAQELRTVLDQISVTPGFNDTGFAEPVIEQEFGRDALAANMRQLAAFLTDNDSRAAQLAERLVHPLRSVGQGAAGKQLESAISGYEFEDALATLQALAQALGITLESGLR
ncbi:MAG: response regulator [Rhodoferax sp.]|nr:response regulator [Rhodoferax sp.]